MNNYNFTSVSQQNQIINAIRFLYKEVLNKKYDKVSFKRPKKEKKLPKVDESKHERDSSHDRFECLECGYIKHGLTGECEKW